MDARLIRAALFAATLLSLGAGSFRTQNFIVTAPTPHFAQQVAMSAEKYRRDLAVEWLGRELPPWHQPCPIQVDVGPNKGAGGATSFAFHSGQPMDWTMSIQGSAERILDSVLPHEVTHTIFATHFGRPLPRWADEGACTTVEHESERQKQHRMLYEFLTTDRGIAFNQMFAMANYPPDVLPLYAQGYSLARYLIAQGGKHKFIAYVGDGMRWNNWTKATETHYGYKSLSELQVTWLEWVRRGSPPLAESNPTQLAEVEGKTAGQLASLSVTEPNAAASTSQEMLAAAPQRAIPTPPAASSTGWYSRVRDEKRDEKGGRSEAPPAREPSSSLRAAVDQALSRGAPGSPGAPGAPAAQVVTRPQPPQQAEQRILEWTR